MIDEPLEVVVVNGAFVLFGPRAVAVALSRAAAQETMKRLGEALAAIDRAKAT